MILILKIYIGVEKIQISSKSNDKPKSSRHNRLVLFPCFLHRWLLDSMTVRSFCSFLFLVLRICLFIFLLYMFYVYWLLDKILINRNWNLYCYVLLHLGRCCIIRCWVLLF